METVLEALKADFNNHISFREKRPGIVQVIAPLFHEDGDMVDIFFDLPPDPGGLIRISDHGLSLMRLSYSYEIDTPVKQKILNRIISENGVSEDRGRMFIETTADRLYPSLLQFAQTIAKVSSMQAFKREVVHSLFYETLGDFIKSTLNGFNPIEDYLPIPSRNDLAVDWKLDISLNPMFLFGVRDGAKARLAALVCREFQISKLPFRSVIVHDDFELLTKKDQTRITNAADKQFTSLADFRQHGEEYFNRESSLVH